jgi:hypothetical protein
MSDVQNSIDRLLDSDLALKVFVKNKSGSPNVDYTKSNNVWGYKWIDIPTNKDTMIGFKVGDPVKTVPDPNNEKITFLVLQKYDQAKTNEITAALNSGTNKFPGIKFSSNGTIIIDNKIISNFSNQRSSSKTGDTYKNVNEAFYAGNLLSWDSKKIFSQDLKYILWFNDTDKLFYLLYNPIHRPNFKKYYRLSLLNGEINISGEPVGNSEFHDVIVKYCNAFTVKGKELVNQYNARLIKPDVYSDPFCGVLVDRITTILNSALVSSITSSYFKNNFWLHNTTRDVLIAYFEDEDKVPGNHHSWACPFRGTVGSLRDFAIDREMMSEVQDKTFIADLVRLDIKAHTSAFTTAQSAYNFLLTTTDELPACGTGTTINCNQILIANYGDIKGNELTSNCSSRLVETEKKIPGASDRNKVPPVTQVTKPDTQITQPPPITVTTTGTTPTSNITDTKIIPNTAPTIGKLPTVSPAVTSASTSAATPASTSASASTPASTPAATSASTPSKHSGTLGDEGHQPTRKTDIPDKTSIFKDWKPMYTYILIAIVLVIIGIIIYFLMRKSKVSNVTTPAATAAPTAAESTFGRYRY